MKKPNARETERALRRLQATGHVVECTGCWYPTKKADEADARAEVRAAQRERKRLKRAQRIHSTVRWIEGRRPRPAA